MDEQVRKMVEQSLAALFYATHAKELRPSVLHLLDSLVVYFTLISLSLYLPHQDDSDSSSSGMSGMGGTSQRSSSLDFMILVDSLFDVLCNDDSEYWPCVQRIILVMIETSEVISYGGSSGEWILKSQTYRQNLVNLALFDYLAEKVCQLCYERSWFAKKAGCFVIRLLRKRMPFVWLLNNCYSFIRSLMFILVAVTGEVILLKFIGISAFQ